MTPAVLQYSYDCWSYCSDRVRWPSKLSPICGYTYRSYYGFTLAHYGLIICPVELQWQHHYCNCLHSFRVNRQLLWWDSHPLDNHSLRGTPTLYISVVAEQNVTLPFDFSEHCLIIYSKSSIAPLQIYTDQSIDHLTAMTTYMVLGRVPLLQAGT